MKPPVSLDYVIVVALVALSAAALSYTTSQPVFSLAALLLGVYALHLVSVRIVIRQYAGTGPALRSGRGRAAVNADEIKRIREELDSERRELDNQKEELQKKIVAAEQQWELLRQMIRDRVEGSGAGIPDSVIAGVAGNVPPSSKPGRSNGADEEPRIHGRW